MESKGAIQYERKRYSTPDQRMVDRKEKVLIRRVLNKLDPLEKILDVPSGYGRFYNILKERCEHYVGIDISKEMILRLRVRSGGGKEVVGNIYSLPFKDSTFDLVISWRIFQHISDRKERSRALLEISRVSKRWILISFYRENLLHRIERFLTGRKSRISMISVKEILNEARRARLVRRLIIPLFPLFHSQTLLFMEKINGTTS